MAASTSPKRLAIVGRHRGRRAMEDFIAQRSPWRIALRIFVCASFVGLGLWAIGALGEMPQSPRYSPAMTFIIGCFAIVLFGYVGLTSIRTLFGDSVTLRISTLGICWKEWSDQTIPWIEITDVTTWVYQRQKFIILHLRDSSHFPSRATEAPFSAINRALTGGEIAISLAATDRSDRSRRVSCDPKR